MRTGEYKKPILLLPRRWRQKMTTRTATLMPTMTSAKKFHFGGHANLRNAILVMLHSQRGN